MCDFRVGLLYVVALANDQTGLISISAVYSNKSIQDKLYGTSIKIREKLIGRDKEKKNAHSPARSLERKRWQKRKTFFAANCLLPTDCISVLLEVLYALADSCLCQKKLKFKYNIFPFLS